MKTLGLIGGTSWVSTADYYRYINTGINERLGGLNFAQCIIYSLNFGEMKKLADDGDTAAIVHKLTTVGHYLKDSGAEGIVLCANTLHLHAAAVNDAVGLPVIHIAEATAKAIRRQGLSHVGLLGTKPTMELDFYKDKLREQGVTTVTPNEADRSFIQHTIFDELGRGIFLPATKDRYLSIISDLVRSGAQGVILGCTEIPLIISQGDVTVPVFDTARIHADAAVEFALQ